MRREIAYSPFVSYTDPSPKPGQPKGELLRGALESSWLDYEHVNTVVVQGTTVVVAREAGVTGSEMIESSLCFNVLSVSTDGSGASEWVGFRKLPLPNELLLVGKEIVNVLTRNRDSPYLIPVTDAGGRFRVVPFGESIYIFRRTTEGTLLSTRFCLIREGSTATPDRVSYSLESPWVVRFQASEKPDTQANDQGVQSYQSLSKEPTREPTFELSMVRGLSTDSFDVEIVPLADGRAMCHVFQVLPDKSKTQIFSVPIDESGQYDLQGLL
jgi:hypothetical protein